MHIYCETCNKHAANTFPKKITLISKNKIKEESICAICFNKNVFIDETEYDLENALEVFFNFLLINIKQEKKFTIRS